MSAEGAFLMERKVIEMTATERRALAASYMVQRAGKNNYSQEDRGWFWGKPEGKNPGVCDCSNSVRQAIKRAAGIDIGSNTDAQIRNRAKGVLVHKSNGDKYPPEKLLLPGDCVYFLGNVAHAWNCGHVEMYTGKGTLYGHGSGKGPKKHDLKTYGPSRGSGKGYLCVIRWILDDAADTVDAPTIYPAKPTPEAPPAPVNGVVITGSLVNLRTGPSTDYATVDTVKAGQVFEAVDTEWYPILVNGRVLWVSNKMAKKV